MFTGLIAELGKVEDLRREQNSYRLTIAAQTIPPLLKIGESVCCNGACLTVTKFDSQRFTVDVMPETARRTTIGSLKKGDRIIMNTGAKRRGCPWKGPSMWETVWTAILSAAMWTG